MQLGDVGTSFRLTILDQDGAAVDLTGATTTDMIFTGPNGAKFTKDADVYGTATNGVIKYDVLANDFPVVGEWKVQAYVVTAAGSWYSNIVKFFVRENL